MNFILSISVGVVKLTGPAATGKTRLLQQLETELQAERQETLLFPSAPTSIKDLHDTISRKLKLDNEFGFNKALIHHIIAKPYDQQRLVVVFDDAEKIDIDVLLAIALFRNIMHNNQPIVSIVLCGSEALNAKLEDSSYRPLVQDMLISYELNPLTKQQLQAYGHACADIHRLGKLPLKNGVLTELFAESQGLPGVVPDLLKKVRDKVASGALVPKVEEMAAPVAKVAPVVEAAPAAKAAAKAAPPAKVKPAKAAKAPKVVPAPAPVVTALANADLTPDERLILASRAEKEESSKFAFTIDWQRYKPLMQGTAMAAGLLVVVVVGWPRIAPTVSNLYASLTDSAEPEVIPAEPVAPAQVAEEQPASAEETPAPAEPIPEVVEETPALVAEATEEPVPVVEEPAPVVEEPAPVVEEAVAVTEPEPVVAEPEPAVAEPEPAVVEPEPAQVATTTPEPAPATPVPAQVARIAGPTLTNASPDELESVIREWLTAWQDQDVDDFFSYYHTDFAPLYQDTRADWRMDREGKISQPTSIMIELEDFMVESTSRIGTRVSFWMTYESPTYADRTLKEVLIGPDLDGQLRILQEYNQQVAELGAASTGAVASSPAPQAGAGQGPQRTQIANSPLPQSAFPAAVTPPPVVARASFTPQQIDEIARFLAEWLTAWQNQDADEYFRYYEPAYKPDFMASAEQWRNERIEKINRPTRIVLRMDQLEILAGDDDSVRVQLVLEYHSTHYADRTLKEIELRKGQSGAWLIAQEKNKEVEPLPLMRLLPVDSLAFLVMNH